MEYEARITGGNTVFMQLCIDKSLPSTPELIRLLAESEYGCVDENGDTGFILACLNKNTDVVKELVTIEKFNEFNHLNNDDMTASMMMVIDDDVDMLSIIRNVELRRQNSTGDTSLILAAQRNNVQMCKLLLGELGLQK